MKQLATLLLGLTFWLAACTSGNTNTPATSAPLVATLPTLGEVVGTPSATIPPLPTLDAAGISQGQTIYQTHCAACHGVNLEGQPDWQTPNEDGSFRAPPHDATGHTWHHSDAVLLEAIRLGGARVPANLGASAMPAFAGVITEIEMTAVLTYIKSTWPQDIRTLQWEATVRDQSS
jgi:mono/diheme cytochrome c family protein